MTNYYRVMLCEAKVLLRADSEDEAKQTALDHFKRTLMVDDLIAWEETPQRVADDPVEIPVT